MNRPWAFLSLTPNLATQGLYSSRNRGIFQDFWCAPSSLHTEREADKIKKTGFAQLEKDFDGS